MHFGRHYRDHTHIARDIVPLDPRDPSLITLPISVPSIPIVGAILTPIIGGTNQAATTTSTSTSTPNSDPTTTPSTVTPAPTSTAPSNNGNGGDTSSSSTLADSSGSSTSIGDTAGSNSASGTSTGSSAQPSDGSGNGQSGSSNSSNGDGSSTNDNNTFNPPVANAGGSSDSSSSSSGSGSDTDGNSNNGGTSHQSTGLSGISSPGSTSSSGNGAIPTGNSGVSSNHGGISSGAIAGIVVVLLLILLVIAVIVFRRRHINRRAERLNSWWSIAKRRSSREGGESPSHSNRSRNSVRSSFATTFDHAQTPQLRLSFGDAPPVPPMAEIRGDDNVGPFQPFSPNSAVADSPVLITFDYSHPSPVVSKKRTSAPSVASNGSGAQYLIVPGGNADGQEVTTPMSVRPFSPSESFSFPKPPKKQSGDWSSNRPLSANTSNSGATVYAISSDPFSDPVPLPGQFSPIESVRRPFESTRHDELTVAVADRVKVLRLFDDGWALVEKLLAFEEIVGNDGQNMHGAQGLIPIDCFRAEGQDLTTFLTEKRVASNLYDSAYAGVTA